MNPNELLLEIEKRTNKEAFHINRMEMGHTFQCHWNTFSQLWFYICPHLPFFPKQRSHCYYFLLGHQNILSV